MAVCIFCWSGIALRIVIYDLKILLMVLILKYGGNVLKVMNGTQKLVLVHI